MMRRISVYLSGMLLVFLLAGTAHAGLTFPVVYDDVNNLFWLQDANMSGSSMTWYQADEWARDLDDGVWDDWRLPTIEELVSLHDQGVSSSTPGPFENVSYLYWSGTEYSPRFFSNIFELGVLWPDTSICPSI